MPYVIGAVLGVAVSGWAAFTSLAWIDENAEEGGVPSATMWVVATLVLLFVGAALLWSALRGEGK